jgi:hypothetical protein
MMKRRVLLYCGIIAAVAVAGVILIAWWTAPANVTTIERSTKVDLRMNDAEVVRVLGSDGASGPFSKALANATELDEVMSGPKRQQCPPWSGLQTYIVGGVVLDSLQWKEWQTRENDVIVIGFDRVGLVAVKARFSLNDNWTFKIRRWLRLQ